MLAGCGLEVTEPEPCHFIVMDVGQGLAQACVVGSRAVLFDAGPARNVAGLRAGLREAGMPYLDLVVLSHADEDHRGGLGCLDSTVPFSGLVAVNPYEDTALIRAEAGWWAARLRFMTVARGQTLEGPPGVEITCLWPPADTAVGIPVPDELRNAFSLVFSVRYEDTGVLVTSDVDSVVLSRLLAVDGSALQSEVVVVPHHGSASSVHRGFYGAVQPQWAIVPCARDNDYGHPAPQLVDVLFELGIDMRTTYECGALHAVSNGWYWTWRQSQTRLVSAGSQAILPERLPGRTEGPQDHSPRDNTW